MFFGALWVLWGSLWAPLGAPGAPLGSLWAPLGAPGAPLGVQGRKSNENHGSFPPVLGPVLEHFLVKTAFFSPKNALQERVFCGVLFLSGIGLNFHRFLRRWNHENLNSVWERRRNQEKHKIESGAAPGAILGVILAHFWACLVPLWATLAEKGAPERVQKKGWKKVMQVIFRSRGEGGASALN